MQDKLNNPKFSMLLSDKIENPNIPQDPTTLGYTNTNAKKARES